MKKPLTRRRDVSKKPLTRWRVRVKESGYSDTRHYMKGAGDNPTWQSDPEVLFCEG